MNEQYVTLFSNTSSDLFPNNTTSRFTAKLPKPLDFGNDKYECGLVEIFHPPIKKSIISKDKEDVIKIPMQSWSEADDKFTIFDFAELCIHHAKRPEIYNDEHYFDEFLDEMKLGNFRKNYKEHLKAVLPDSIQSFTLSLTILKNDLYKQVPTFRKQITLEFEVEYTLKQILYHFLDEINEVLTQKYLTMHPEKLKVGPNSAALQESLNVDNGKYLSLYAKIFINAIKESMPKAPHQTSYLIVYCDIISSSIVGNTIAKLLYISKRKSLDEDFNLILDKIKFFPVEKNYIEDITILFAAEDGSQINFVDSWTPSCVQLLFRKIS